MGELDLCIDCYNYDPFVEGARAAMLTVFFSWAPLMLAGIGLNRTSTVRATMRGAGVLRVLARVAITILVAGAALPLLLALELMGGVLGGRASVADGILIVTFSSAVLSPIIALSVFGIRAWHLVLEELTSPPGERRMLV